MVSLCYSLGLYLPVDSLPWDEEEEDKQEEKEAVAWPKILLLCKK